jgi:four helix bundle protein
MGKSFRDLKIWQKASSLTIQIYKITASFPKDEKYGLTDQIRRAANSVSANIAEAHGRFHYADKCRVLYQARGECEEVRSHLSLAVGLSYLKEDDFMGLDREFEGLGVGINAYILSLKDLA